jgi:hypothetical protein
MNEGVVVRCGDSHIAVAVTGLDATGRVTKSFVEPVAAGVVHEVAAIAVVNVAAWIVCDVAAGAIADTAEGDVIAETDATGVVRDAAVVAFDEAETVVGGAEYSVTSMVVGIVAVSEVSGVEDSEDLGEREEGSL